MPTPECSPTLQGSVRWKESGDAQVAVNAVAGMRLSVRASGKPAVEYTLGFEEGRGDPLRFFRPEGAETAPVCVRL